MGIKDTYYAIAENIRFIWERSDLTQEELAERVGVSASYIYKIESGRAKVGLETLIKIKDEFQVDANKLFGDNDCDPYSSQCNKEFYSIIRDCAPKDRFIIFETLKTLRKVLQV